MGIEMFVAINEMTFSDTIMPISLKVIIVGKMTDRTECFIQKVAQVG